jgi:hypothetical protein
MTLSETTTSEQSVPFNRILCPTLGRDGKPPHVSTLIRWATRGTRLRDGSRVRLRAVKTPGGWRSSAEWVTQFLDILTRDRLGADSDDAEPGASATVTTPTPRPPAPRRRSARERDAAATRAGEILAGLGC